MGSRHWTLRLGQTRSLSWFPDALLDGHLAALAALQQDDGGWPVAWEPPTEDAHRAWRGIQTLAAITTLVACVKAQD